MQTQNIQSVKSAKDIALEGITVEMVMENTAIGRIVLRDAKGNFVEFQKSAYDGVKAFVAAPPKMKDAHRVTGKLAGIAICEDYESSYTADQRKRDLRDAGATEPTVEKVKVLDDADLLEEIPA